MTPSTTPTMPDSSVAKRAMEAVTGSRVGQVVADVVAVDDRGAEVTLDQARDVVEELGPERQVPAELGVLRGDLLGGGAGMPSTMAPGLPSRGVHQQEADQDGGEHRGDGEEQPTRDVGEHVGLLRSCGVVGVGRPGRWPAAAGRCAAATGRSARRSGSAGLMLGQHEVVVRAGELRLGHLVGVVADVGEVLVDRDVPALRR